MSGIFAAMPIAIIAGTDAEITSGKAQLMLTRTQAAARLGVTERRIKQFVDDALLTPYEEKLFHIPLFPANDVEELRQSRLKRY